MAELKATCKGLDDTIKTCTARNIKSERLIKTLKEDDEQENWDDEADQEAQNCEASRTTSA